MEKNVQSWKRKIRYMQILFFTLIIIVYIIYGYFTNTYSQYKNTLKKLDNIQTKLLAKQDKLDNIKQMKENLENIVENQTGFINSYNNCYKQYIDKKYEIGAKDFVFSDCIYKLYKKTYIAKFKSEDIEKIGIALGIYNDKSKKFNFDQGRILYSLDKNIFQDNLESKVSLLSFSNPTLIDSKLNLYKVSFTLTTKVNYAEFINLFNQLQNRLFDKDNVYYSIENISMFDIMNETDKQSINIQGSFYFSK